MEYTRNIKSPLRCPWSLSVNSAFSAVRQSACVHDGMKIASLITLLPDKSTFRRRLPSKLNAIGEVGIGGQKIKDIKLANSSVQSSRQGRVAFTAPAFQLFHQQSLATAVRHQFSLVQRDSLQRPRELVGGTPLLGVLSIAGNRAALLARLLAHSVDSGTPVSCATSATGLFAARSSG